jgi:hypothetical protein
LQSRFWRASTSVRRRPGKKWRFKDALATLNGQKETITVYRVN